MIADVPRMSVEVSSALEMSILVAMNKKLVS